MTTNRHGSNPRELGDSRPDSKIVCISLSLTCFDESNIFVAWRKFNALIIVSFICDMIKPPEIVV